MKDHDFIFNLFIMWKKCSFVLKHNNVTVLQQHTVHYKQDKRRHSYFYTILHYWSDTCQVIAEQIVWEPEQLTQAKYLWLHKVSEVELFPH